MLYLKIFFTLIILVISLIIIILLINYEKIYLLIKKNLFYLVGRFELFIRGKNNSEKLIKTKQGYKKLVDVYQNYVYAFLPFNEILKIRELHQKAKKINLDDVLNPIIEHGFFYIKYPRCSHVMSHNIKEIENIDLNIEQISHLRDLNVYDLHKDNLMLCGNKIKLVDQENIAQLNNDKIFNDWKNYIKNLL